MMLHHRTRCEKQAAAPHARERPAGPITDWSDFAVDAMVHQVAIFDAVGAVVRVVGVQQYQGTLGKIAGGRTIDGAKDRDHFAVMAPEPHNVYDRRAVRIVLTQQGDRPRSAHIGYLLRADALAYRPVIDRLAAGGLVVACRASIEGGWRRDGDVGLFGVRLHLDLPRNLMHEIDESVWSRRLPAAPAGWDADPFGTVLDNLGPTPGAYAGPFAMALLRDQGSGRLGGRHHEGERWRRRPDSNR